MVLIFVKTVCHDGCMVEGTSHSFILLKSIPPALLLVMKYSALGLRGNIKKEFENDFTSKSLRKKENENLLGLKGHVQKCYLIKS